VTVHEMQRIAAGQVEQVEQVAQPSAGGGVEAARERDAGTDWLSAIPFVAMHLAVFAVVFTGFSLRDAILATVLYTVRMFFITAGYHRYFAHRSYRLSRPAQLVMAVGGITAAQKGPLWWAAHHRRHHRYTDTDRDLHSPRDGLWWSHVGWILSRRYKRPDLEAIADFARYPELRLVDRFQVVGAWALGAACYLVAGWGGVMAFVISTVALWHATFAVNSVAHRLGRRRYDTPDDSRNCWPVALLTLGEGWHNNHHHYAPSVRQGFRWWELDCTYYVLRALAVVRVAHDLRVPPARALAHRLVEPRT